MAASASDRIDCTELPVSLTVIPRLACTSTSWPPTSNRSDMADETRAASPSISSMDTSVQRITNSSPPNRATVSSGSYGHAQPVAELDQQVVTDPVSQRRR